ncbi:putative ribonuclease H-like domain-containing protein, partial [Tanacetum coccineum]
MGLLRTELEKVKEEKEGFEFKIAKFEKSAKDLDQMLKSLEEFKQPKTNEYGPRDSSVKPTTVSDDEDDVEPIPKIEKKTVIPTATKKDFVKPEKPVRRSVSCPKTSHPSTHKYMAPRAVLMKTSLKSVNTTRPVNTVRSVNTGRPFSTARSFNTVRPSYTTHLKSTVHCARPRTYFQNQAQSTVHRPFYKRTTLTKRSYNQRFNTGRQNINTGRQNVNTVRARGFNTSNSHLNDKGFVDSGCSRHMTGNIAHLSDFKDFDGGYVTFGGGPYGQNYWQSFDMKNIVPKDCLTCLVAKATSEESMLWHRRLGHINFKNINKLVKENL